MFEYSSVNEKGKLVTTILIKTHDGRIDFEIVNWKQFLRFRDMWDILAGDVIFLSIITSKFFDDFVKKYAEGDKQEKFHGELEIANTEEKVKFGVFSIDNKIQIKSVDQTIIQEIIIPKLSICQECGEVFQIRRFDQRFHNKKCKNRYLKREWRKLHKKTVLKELV